MEEFFIKMFRFIAIISIFALFYFIFAGIWEFNPTDIENLNVKGVTTSILFIFISVIANQILD